MTKDATKETLERILAVYRPEGRYLTRCSYEYPSIKGEFIIPQTVYINEGDSFGHFTAVDLLLCYNQLAYSGFAEMLNEGTFDKFPKIEFNKFLEYQRKNCLMINVNKMKFRQSFRSDQPFSGIINVKRIMKKGQNYFLKTNFEVESGKASADIDLAFANT